MIKEEDLPDSVDNIDYSLPQYFIVKNDEKNQKIYVPKPIIESESVFSIDFHPKLDLITMGLVTGESKIYKYSIDIENTCVATFNHHSEACRKLFFSDDGKLMFSSGSDMKLAVTDIKKGALKYSIKDAHTSPINTLIVIDDDRIATGDDEGCVRIWDIRQRKAIKAYTEHGDYISCFDYAPETGLLYSASADGCISVVDMKKSKPSGLAVTEGLNDDLVSLTTMQSGQLLYAAGASGVIYEFDTDKLFQPKRNIKSLSTSISSMIQVRDGMLTYATDDGVIYSLDTKKSKLSNRLTDQTNEPIIDMSISRDAKYLANKEEKKPEIQKMKKKEKKAEKSMLNPEAKATIDEAEKNVKKRKKAGGVQSATKKTKVLNQARKQFLHDLLVDY
ncbi:hypothetical protein C9374_004340 [Naegleria lovaniensis]|uniref:Guanine nucleotide-binding protein subunit beta-like protein n=1 Tax=Naegleria lovaniensis TaxID=51637 RepID=A0AA88GMC5_NAELO|nr:uncharacterized protein C9374_004340 [Naegleria lovaniensis]KAG2383669.1 hypothetical protein C9374_004340 [Naegleria lovaniensis]